MTLGGVGGTHHWAGTETSSSRPKRAFIFHGPEHWPNTCSVEVAGLRDVTGSKELVDFAILLAKDRNFRGILHWGQRNEFTRADVEDRYGEDLVEWRKALRRVTENGRLDGFSSSFTRRAGLEPR